jgi:heme exporter protein A
MVNSNLSSVFALDNGIVGIMVCCGLWIGMLSAQSLACRRGGRLVFRDMAFDLHVGTIMLVMGTNGSGKSTLLRTVAGLVPVADGRVTFNGQALLKDKFHYIGHLDAVKPELTVTEMLSFWQSLMGAAALVSDPFGIKKLHDKPVRLLSAGQKRRLALTRLMMRDVPLWLLDEPTTGLDTDGQKILCDMLQAHRQGGGIALIATHQALDIQDVWILNMVGVRV